MHIISAYAPTTRALRVQQEMRDEETNNCYKELSKVTTKARSSMQEIVGSDQKSTLVQ